MSKRTTWSGAWLALGLCLVVPLGAAAQSESADDTAVPVPVIEGLGWYRSIDLTGSEIQETQDTEEVDDWAAMLGDAGATFDQLEYTFQSAFDPATLPQVGGLATVRIDGADTDSVLTAVIGDIVSQAADYSSEAPELQEATVGEKSVTIVTLPDDMSAHDAIVYASGDAAWIFLMDEDLAALGLEQLP